MPDDKAEWLGPRCGDIVDPLEYDEPGALAHDKPVPVDVKGARGELGAAHVAAHRIKPHEAAHRSVADEGVNATGKNHVGGPPSQQLHALTDGCGARSARGGEGHARSFEAEPQ